MICRKCGASVGKGSKFCTVCGTTIKSKSKAWIPALVVIAVLVIAFCALWMFTDIFRTNRGDGSGGVRGSDTRDSGAADTEGAATPARSQNPSENVNYDIPAIGGSTRADSRKDLSFAPGRSGMWEFAVSESDDMNPVFAINDERGMNVDMFRGIEGEGVVYSFYAYLREGVAYSINAHGADFDRINYVLTVQPREDLEISPDGGVYELYLDEEIWDRPVYALAPDRSGVWKFSTSHDNDTDPALRVTELGMAGLISSSMETDIDSGGNDDALIYKYLKAGGVYIIKALNIGNAGVFSFAVEFTSSEGPSDVRWIPCGGGNVYIEFDEPVVAFVPNRSGEWNFYINSDYGWTPSLEITSMDGSPAVASDELSDDPRSLFVAGLSAGTVYLIQTDFDYDDAGEYYDLCCACIG